MIFEHCPYFKSKDGSSEGGGGWNKLANSLPLISLFKSSILTTPSSYHRRIQVIKRDENVHKRTIDDNDDV